jgi:hypothetical protein
MITALFYCSGICFFTAFSMWMYNTAYTRGYEIGKHSGFSEGLFKCYENKKSRNNLISY